MKNKLLLMTMFLLASLTFMACSDNHTQAGPEVPYEVYIYTDPDGCLYLIVHDQDHYNDGIGLGIIPKIKQPDKCTQQ